MIRAQAFLLVWVVGLAIIVAACGGDDDDQAGPADRSVSRAQAVVSSALITLEDLPGVWEEQDLEPDVNGDELCGGIELGERGRALVVENVAFISREGLEPVLAQSVAGYASGDAQIVFDEIKTAIEACIESRVNVGQQGAEFSPLQAPDAGDEAFSAVISSTPDAPLPLAFHYIIVRRADYLLVVVFGAAGVPEVDPTRTEAVFRIADNKLADAIAME